MRSRKIFIVALFFIITAVAIVWVSFYNNDAFEAPVDYTSKVEGGDVNLSAKQTYEELNRKGFQPRADVKPWSFTTPVNWAANPFNDRNWQFQLHAWRGIDPILVKYDETGDTSFFEESINFILDWHSYHENHRASSFSWYDMAAGLRAMKMAFIIDEIYEGKVESSKSDVDKLLELADEHAVRLQDEGFISLGNHGVFQIFGLNLLCSVIEDRPSCEGARGFAKEMFDKIIDHAYTSEGVHKEHSPFYHGFTTIAINKFDASKFNSSRALSLLEQAVEVQPWLVWPDGKYVEVGDSEGKSKPLSGEVDLTCLEDDRCYAVGDYTNSGYAIVRSDPSTQYQSSMLFVTGMAYSTTHKHADELSFSLFENGEQVFIDSGKYGYEHDKWWDYTRSPLAHNTISLADKEIGRSDVEMDGSLLSSINVDKGRFFISGELVRPGLFSQKRVIEYDPGQTLVIQDEVSSQTERRFVSSLHLAPNLRPELTESGFDVQLNGGDVVRARIVDDDCVIEKVRGQEDPVLGWQSVGYLEMEPTTVVQAICLGTNRTITWNVQLQ